MLLLRVDVSWNVLSEPGWGLYDIWIILIGVVLGLAVRVGPILEFFVGLWLYRGYGL